MHFNRHVYTVTLICDCLNDNVSIWRIHIFLWCLVIGGSEARSQAVTNASTCLYNEENIKNSCTVVPSVSTIFISLEWKKTK